MPGRTFPKRLLSYFRNGWWGLSELGGRTLAKYAIARAPQRLPSGLNKTGTSRCVVIHGPRILSTSEEGHDEIHEGDDPSEPCMETAFCFGICVGIRRLRKVHEEVSSLTLNGGTELAHGFYCTMVLNHYPHRLAVVKLSISRQVFSGLADGISLASCIINSRGRSSASPRILLLAGHCRLSPRMGPQEVSRCGFRPNTRAINHKIQISGNF